jgi:dual specificity phosphatase 12
MKAEYDSANPGDEILPGLWLGSIKAATNGHWLSNHRIQVIFNCTKDIPFHFSVKRTYRIPVDDNLEMSEIRNLELWSFEIIYKILQEYKTGNPILIHCAAGVQRSAATMAMVLIVLKNMTPEDAITFIRNKRSIAFRPGVNFIDAIQGFYRSYQKVRLDY